MMTKASPPIPPRSPDLDRRMENALKDARVLRSQYMAVLVRAVWEYLRDSLGTAARSSSRPARRAVGPVR